MINQLIILKELNMLEMKQRRRLRKQDQTLFKKILEIREMTPRSSGRL